MSQIRERRVVPTGNNQEIEFGKSREELWIVLASCAKCFQIKGFDFADLDGTRDFINRRNPGSVGTN